MFIRSRQLERSLKSWARRGELLQAAERSRMHDAGRRGHAGAAYRHRLVTCRMKTPTGRSRATVVTVTTVAASRMPVPASWG